MWIFSVKRPPGSLLAFKARYVARGFNQRQGVDFFQTFSPTLKMTTPRVLPHVSAQRAYELHSLDFSTAFLQGSLHEEIWLSRLPGFSGSFPESTQWSLRWPVYGLREAPREWHNTLTTTLAALGFAPLTSDPLLFLRTDSSLPLFYILVYIDDLIFATADTEALVLVKAELQKRHTSTYLGDLRSYLGLHITRDRAARTITLIQSHMVQQVLQRFCLPFPSPQPSPLPTGHSPLAPPLNESVELGGLYLVLVGCLMYLMTCTRPDLAYPLSILACFVAPGKYKEQTTAKRVLRYMASTPGMGLVLGGRGRVVFTGHSDASWADNQETRHSSQGYTFSIGSGFVSWGSTRSSYVLSSSCEAGVYGGHGCTGVTLADLLVDRLGRAALFSSSLPACSPALQPARCAALPLGPRAAVPCSPRLPLQPALAPAARARPCSPRSPLQPHSPLLPTLAPAARARPCSRARPYSLHSPLQPVLALAARTRLCSPRSPLQPCLPLQPRSPLQPTLAPAAALASAAPALAPAAHACPCSRACPCSPRSPLPLRSPLQPALTPTACARPCSHARPCSRARPCNPRSPLQPHSPLQPARLCCPAPCVRPAARADLPPVLTYRPSACAARALLLAPASRGGQQQPAHLDTLSPQRIREWIVQRGRPEAAALGASESAAAQGASESTAALGASSSTATGPASAEALHTFTVDSGVSRCFFRDCTTVTPLAAPMPVSLADPSGGPVVARASTVLPCPAVPSGALSSLHLPSFSTNLVSNVVLKDALVDIFTPRGQCVSICQVAALSQVFASGQLAASYSCRILSHQTLLWHHRLDHPSLPCLRNMHSCLLISGLPRSLPPLLCSLAPPYLPCVEGRQRATPHSSSFPPTTAPLQTLHMDVWGLAPVHGTDQERYFLLVVDDYTRYTTVFPLRSKGSVRGFLIPWIVATRHQLQ
ncbi:unnamed protein product [Closterium sp. NIES-54]